MESYIVLLLSVFVLLPDILDGMVLINESTLKLRMKGMITGLIVLNVLVFTVVASLMYLQASSVSDITMVKDIVVILFMLAIDENLQKFLRFMFPAGLEKQQNDALDSRQDELLNIIKKIDKKLDEINMNYARMEAIIKYKYYMTETVKEALREALTDLILDDVSEMRKIIEDNQDEIVELCNEYTVEIGNEYQRRSEGTNSHKITSFFKPMMKVQKNQVPCDFSEMQSILKGENDTIMKISDACAT